MATEEEGKKAMRQEELESSKRVYERCIATRDFEISQLSSRNNFLMIFQGVLFAGLIQSAGSFPILSFMACLTGFVVSFYQTKIAAGAKYWQEHWESELKAAEIRLLSVLREASGREPVQLFSKDGLQIKDEVRKRLDDGNSGWLIKLLILKKFSVSRVPIELGVALLVIWFVLLMCTLNFGLWVSVPSFITGFKH